MAPNFPPPITTRMVDKAAAGVIETPLLEEVARIARIAASDEGKITHAQGSLLLLCTAPLLDELLLYRVMREEACDLGPPDDNVVSIEEARR